MNTQIEALITTLRRLSDVRFQVSELLDQCNGYEWMTDQKHLDWKFGTPGRGANFAERVAYVATKHDEWSVIIDQLQTARQNLDSKHAEALALCEGMSAEDIETAKAKARMWTAGAKHG